MTTTSDTVNSPQAGSDMVPLRAKSGWIIALGIVYLVAGLVALGSVAMATVASVLIVGVMMMHGAKLIPWDDFTEALPAFLAIVVMPLTVSITDGIAFGFISMAVLKLATGRGRELRPLAYLFAALLLVRYLL